MTGSGKIVVPYIENLECIKNAGEIRFHAYVEDLACDVRIPINTGREKELLDLLLSRLNIEKIIDQKYEPDLADLDFDDESEGVMK